MPFQKKGDVEKSPATRQMLISALDDKFLFFSGAGRGIP